MQLGGPAQRPTVHLVIPGLTDFNVGEKCGALERRRAALLRTYYGTTASCEWHVKRGRAAAARREMAAGITGSQGFSRRRRAALRPAAHGPVALAAYWSRAAAVALIVEELDAKLHRVAARTGRRPAHTISRIGRVSNGAGAFAARQDIGELQRMLRKED